jgi:16S rRNA (cytidine1402-2'-O)-methyltransferase
LRGPAATSARVSDTSDPQTLPAGLYIVATPIGNLGDMTVRGARVLAQCAAIACEDTRVTAKLLRHLEISRPLVRHDDHASAEDRARLLATMAEQPVALVSDAGMPLVSDPGYRLVREARAAGVPVTVIPGPSAPVTALALSGLPSDRFLFAGFLPPKDKARGEVLAELAPVRTTLVFFETAPRLERSLQAIAEQLPGREVAVARELTKLYEECRTGTAEELLEHYRAHPPRGEIVLLVGPPVEGDGSGVDVDALLASLLADHKPSHAAAEAARQTGQDRRTLYARALELRDK